MLNIAVKVGENCTVNVDITEREALSRILAQVGVFQFLNLVRAAVEDVADPTEPVGTNGSKAYMAINGLDQTILDVSEV
jgi:hypothetical protein